MPTPNRLDIVQQVDRERPELLQANTTASCTQFRQLVAARLHALDPDWGELTKRPGETQGPDRRAVDAIIHRRTQQVVDIIGGAEAGPERRGRPAWLEVPKRAGNDWVAPGLAGQPRPGPEPEPGPEPHPQPRPAPADLAPAVAALESARAEIALLTAAIEALEARLAARIAAAESALADRIAALETAEYTVDIGTSRVLGHAHTAMGSVTRVR